LSDKIGIINYGLGNLASVKKALDFCGFESGFITRGEEFADFGRYILPGVGAFRDAIDVIREKGFDGEIKKAVRDGKYLLGICLGLQLLFDKSLENGEFEGLGLLGGEVVRIEGVLKVPHMGWNSLEFKGDCPLFEGLPPNPCVYFVHSYHMNASDKSIVSAVCDYGGKIEVAARKDNIFAVQFHPEKSGEDGVKMLKNFGNLL
jgi:glutamine amidotransferase